MAAGAFAGVCYWTASYPLDVAKSRIQNLPPDKASGSVFEALRAIHREGGYRGLFKGYTTRYACLVQVSVFVAHFDIIICISVVRSLPAAGTSRSFGIFALL